MKLSPKHISSKESISLRISVTDHCQLQCIYCRPDREIPLLAHDDILRYEEIITFLNMLKRCFNLQKVHITGGDPLLRKDISAFVRMLKLLGVSDIAMTTNGQVLQERARELKSAGLDRINISLDSLDPATYSMMSSGADLEMTLNGIYAALAAGIRPIKLNTVVMKDVNDHELTDIAAFAAERNCTARFLELMPTEVMSENFTNFFVPAVAMKEELEKRFKLTEMPRESSSSSRYFEAAVCGRKSTIGFITSHSEPFCSDCNRLRLSADGNISGCLALNNRTSIMDAIRANDERAVISEVKKALKRKRSTGCFETIGNMAAIGG